MPSPLEQAFSECPDLLSQIQSHISRTGSEQLFDKIADHVNILKRHYSASSNERLNKKRKLDEGAASSINGLSDLRAPVNKGNWDTAEPWYIAKEISFSVPQRKKLTLELSSERPHVRGGKSIGNGQTIDAGAHDTGGIRAINPATGEVEFGLGWRDIEQIICLPVPEKQQRTHNLLIIPVGNDGISHPDLPLAEQIVFTLPESSPKTVSLDPPHAPTNFSGPFPEVNGETYITSTIRALNAGLAYYNKAVVLPDEAEFASAIPQSHRKGEKAFHAKAFRGSKEGYLYFLPMGVVFGFKKPLLLIQFHCIDSISYTSILQRTFNIVVATSDPLLARGPDEKDGQKTEIEFGMVDQADFAGIDTWVKKHGLNDLSMAEQRRAKLNASAGARPNGPDDSAGNGAAERKGKEDRYEPGELERAARQAEDELQDQEDEEEEDYDPGSEGESEGEGESSEEYEADDGEEVAEGEEESEQDE